MAKGKKAGKAPAKGAAEEAPAAPTYRAPEPGTVKEWIDEYRRRQAECVRKPAGIYTHEDAKAGAAWSQKAEALIDRVKAGDLAFDDDYEAPADGYVLPERPYGIEAEAPKG